MNKKLLFSALLLLTSGAQADDTRSLTTILKKTQFVIALQASQLSWRTGFITDATLNTRTFKDIIVKAIDDNDIDLLNYYLGSKNYLDLMHEPITIQGYNPLTYAIMHGSAEMVQALINHGASPSHQDNKKKVPFHYLDKNDPEYSAKYEILLKNLKPNLPQFRN